MMWFLTLILGFTAGGYLTHRYYSTIGDWVDYWSDFWKRSK